METPKTSQGTGLGVKDFLGFVDRLRLAARSESLDRNLVQNLDQQLSTLKSFLGQCDRNDPHIQNVIRLLKSEMMKVLENRSLQSSNLDKDQVFEYFSRISQEFNTLESVRTRGSNKDNKNPNNTSLDSQKQPTSEVLRSNLFAQFYHDFAEAFGTSFDSTSERSDSRGLRPPSPRSGASYLKMEVQLERFLGPKMLSFEEQDNESIDRSLQRMLGGFRRLLGQIKRLHEQGQFEGNIQAAFEMKSGAFETKLRDLVHQYLQANVRLEKAQIKKSFSSSGKAREAEILGRQIHAEMGPRQTQNFEKLVQHQMRTTKQIFPFFYTCLIHFSPSEELLKESRAFGSLVSFFGSRLAPKLPIRVLHLLFVLDFLNSVVLRRVWVVHHILEAQNQQIPVSEVSLKGQTGVKTNARQNQNQRNYKDQLIDPLPEDHQRNPETINSSEHASNDSGPNKLPKPKIKLYRGSSSSKQQTKKIPQKEEPPKEFLGFHELQQSELLQGSSLLKSVELGKETYKTSEDVTALMNSSFLATALEAIKLQKQKVESLNEIGERDSENNEGDVPRPSEDIKQQIVNNLHSYFESHQSKMTFRSGGWDASSEGVWNSDAVGKNDPRLNSTSKGDVQRKNNNNSLRPEHQSQTKHERGFPPIKRNSLQNPAYVSEGLEQQPQIYGNDNMRQWTEDPNILSPDFNNSLNKEGYQNALNSDAKQNTGLVNPENNNYSNSLGSQQNTLQTHSSSQNEGNPQELTQNQERKIGSTWTLQEQDNEGDPDTAQSLLKIEGLENSDPAGSNMLIQNFSLVSDSKDSEVKKIPAGNQDFEDNRLSFGKQREQPNSDQEETPSEVQIRRREESRYTNEDSELHVPRYVNEESKDYDDSELPMQDQDSRQADPESENNQDKEGNLSNKKNEPTPASTGMNNERVRISINKQTSGGSENFEIPNQDYDSEPPDYWNDFDSNKLDGDSGLRHENSADPISKDEDSNPDQLNVKSKYPPITESDQHIGKKFVQNESQDRSESFSYANEMDDETGSQGERFQGKMISSGLASGYMESGKNLPKFDKGGKFHRNDLEAQMAKDLFSGRQSKILPSMPSISTNFLQKAPGRPSSEWGPSDSLKFSEVKFESIESVRVPNSEIQSQIDRLVGRIKKIQHMKANEGLTLADRRKKFDSLYFKAVQDAETFKVKDKPQVQAIETLQDNTQQTESEQRLRESGPRLQGVSFVESEQRKARKLLVRQKFTDRLFPPLLSSLCDDVNVETFEEYAQFEFRRISDLLDLRVDQNRIYPLEDSGTQRYRTYRETQWEDREQFMKDIESSVIIDCCFKPEEILSPGRAIFKTISMSLEKCLGQKVAINLFPVVDLKEGKSLVIQPFSLSCPVKEPGKGVLPNGGKGHSPTTADPKDQIGNRGLAGQSADSPVFWNFYDASKRSILGGIPINEWAKKRLEEDEESYHMRRDQEVQLTQRMISSLREDFPPNEYFHSKFIKKNFIFIPGETVGHFRNNNINSEQNPDSYGSIEDKEDWQLLRKKSFCMDDFLPIDPSALPSPESSFPHADFAFSKAKTQEKFNDETSREFLNLFPPLLTKFFARSVGTYRRLFNAHPVELFRTLARAILVKDLSSVEHTEALHISLFPSTMGLPPRAKDHINIYNNLSTTPKRLLDHAHRAHLRNLKNPTEDTKSEVEVSSQYLQVFEDMNIALNLMHFIKSMIENGNCLVFLGASQDLYHVASVKGTTDQVKEMYMVLENHLFHPEIIFHFQFSRFKYAYFVFLHSSLTQETNDLRRRCLDFPSET